MNQTVLTALLEEEWTLRKTEAEQETESKRANRKAEAARNDAGRAYDRLARTRRLLATNEEVLAKIVERDEIEPVVLERWRTHVAQEMTNGQKGG